jgi:hypothetical protein
VSEATQEHLQNLMSQGYITASELMTYRMPEDLSSLVATGAYTVACAAFYEQGFGVLSHRCLRSLLQFYDLELHHLTLLEILHMVAFCDSVRGLYGD